LCVIAQRRPSDDAPAVLTPAPGNPRFPLFDSCRGLAALSILFYHVGAIGGGNADGPFRDIGRTLAIGVPIFFAISGFLLYRPMINARLRGTPRSSVRDYARRRVLRIVPGYWVALTVLAVASGWSEVLGTGFWHYYGFEQIYSRETFDGGLGVAWTLCIEVTFYAALPLYALAMNRVCAGLDVRRAVRREVWVLLTIAAISGVVRAVLGEKWGYGFPSAMLPGTLIWFVPGMLLATWSVAGADAGKRLRAILSPAQSSRSWLIAAGAFAVLAILSGIPAVPQFVGLDLLVPVLAFFVLAPAATQYGIEGRSWRTIPQLLLSNRVLVWLGMVSYGVYLYHATVLAWLDSHGADRIFPFNHWIGLAIATIAVTAPVAGASWYLVERPALRRKRSRRRRAAVLAPPVAVSAPPVAVSAAPERT
jgi:peptidoglycan/LPS O-acetylase OafA/YrhL